MSACWLSVLLLEAQRTSSESPPLPFLLIVPFGFLPICRVCLPPPLLLGQLRLGSPLLRCLLPQLFLGRVCLPSLLRLLPPLLSLQLDLLPLLRLGLQLRQLGLL